MRSREEIEDRVRELRWRHVKMRRKWFIWYAFRIPFVAVVTVAVIACYFYVKFNIPDDMVLLKIILGVITIFINVIVFGITFGISVFRRMTGINESDKTYRYLPLMREELEHVLANFNDPALEEKMKSRINVFSDKINKMNKSWDKKKRTRLRWRKKALDWACNNLASAGNDNR